MSEEPKPVKTLVYDPDIGTYKYESMEEGRVHTAPPPPPRSAPPPFGGRTAGGPGMGPFPRRPQYGPGPGAGPAGPIPRGPRTEDVSYESLAGAARSSVRSHASIISSLLYDLTKEVVWRVGYFSRLKKLIIRSAAGTYRAFKKYILRIG